MWRIVMCHTDSESISVAEQTALIDDTREVDAVAHGAHLSPEEWYGEGYGAGQHVWLAEPDGVTMRLTRLGGLRAAEVVMPQLTAPKAAESPVRITRSTEINRSGRYRARARTTARREEGHAMGTKNSRKNANGEGSIGQRKDGLWQARLSLPDGKRKYFYGRTRQEVSRKLAAARRDRDRGLPVVTDERLTVERYLTQWLERMKPPRVRPSTHRRYTQLLAHVIRAHGSERLTLLTAHQLTSLYAQLQRPRSDGGAGLSASTAHHVHTVLHGALADAVKLDLAPINVSERVNAPKLRRSTIDPYTRQEADRLLDAARGDRLEALYVLAVLTGMRLGELLALTWRQIDLDSPRALADGPTLQVVASLTRSAEGRWQVGEPKTRASRRRIRLIPRARLALIRHQARQRAEREALIAAAGARVWQESDLVFTNIVGGLLDEGNVAKHSYAPLLQRAGLPYRRFHALRHTCATLLVADGVPLQKVSALLGHASISITSDLYAHIALGNYERDTSESMERLFGGNDSAMERPVDTAIARN